ncbi:hypothetical protein BCR34DRAFT_387707 [Clohesyomyces aquaticus]|uniref:Uncharacterized protein n=1 Tax=Clohesyomyces aquaticus TaxID=1231657 RepID=A0A1Y1ZF54_9PLEO|nr:hypothetical protein BCR34DRAFT_387707 [Clohesyomyces aquaticus]
MRRTFALWCFVLAATIWFLRPNFFVTVPVQTLFVLLFLPFSHSTLPSIPHRCCNDPHPRASNVTRAKICPAFSDKIQSFWKVLEIALRWWRNRVQSESMILSLRNMIWDTRVELFAAPLPPASFKEVLLTKDFFANQLSRRRHHFLNSRQS